MHLKLHPIKLMVFGFAELFDLAVGFSSNLLIAISQLTRSVQLNHLQNWSSEGWTSYDFL